MHEAPNLQVSPLVNIYDPNNPLFGSNLVYGDSSQQQQMFNFSSSFSTEIGPFFNQDDGLMPPIGTQNFTGFTYHQPSSSLINSNIGYNNESMGGNMYGHTRGARGSIFTRSQLMELENQKLIYSYISANAAVPPHLLIPLRNSFQPSPGYNYPPNPTRWSGGRQDSGGSSVDPEPGRCRKTDGKKWRCSRNAVADRKYCERHINRGRRHLRNPVVEGQRPINSTGTSSTMLEVTTSVSGPVISNSVWIMPQEFNG